jgi:hypothetical protein
MIAWDQALTWWQDHSTVPFEERLGWHLCSGLVYCTQEAFMMASEVTWNPASREIIQTSGFGLQHSHNAWFVELAVLRPTQGYSKQNPLSLLLQVAPSPREWILFRRNNGFIIHAWRWDHFARRVGHLIKNPSF